MLHAVYGCFICLKMLLQYSLFHKILYTSIHINPIYISHGLLYWKLLINQQWLLKKCIPWEKDVNILPTYYRLQNCKFCLSFFLKKKKKSKLFLKNQLITFEITINYIVHYFFKNFNENYYNRGWSIVAHVRVITAFENWSYFS